MATNIPPHNLGEVIDATLAMIDRQLEGGPAVTLEELMAIVPGPDFPTGAMMLGHGGARNAYATGRGSIMMRATHIIAEGRNDRPSIVLTSIPFQVGKRGIDDKVAEGARDTHIEGGHNLWEKNKRTG